MIKPNELRAKPAHVVALAFLLCGCRTVDAPHDVEALYQSGATPVGAWAAAADDGDDSDPAGNEETEGSGGTAAPSGSGGAGAAGSGSNPGGSGGATGSAGMTGSGGKAATGGTTGSGGMGGSGGTTGSGGATGTGPASTPTSATLDVTTLPQGGRYQPRNAGVIWVEDSSGDYVTTVEVWAARRAGHLHEWLAVNPFGDKADAVSSATLREHKTHHAVWHLKDAEGMQVPDGEYTLRIEVTDRSGTGASTSISFTKGPLPETTMAPDAQFFTGIKLTYE